MVQLFVLDDAFVGFRNERRQGIEKERYIFVQNYGYGGRTRILSGKIPDG